MIQSQSNVQANGQLVNGAARRKDGYGRPIGPPNAKKDRETSSPGLTHDLQEDAEFVDAILSSGVAQFERGSPGNWRITKIQRGVPGRYDAWVLPALVSTLLSLARWLRQAPGVWACLSEMLGNPPEIDRPPVSIVTNPAAGQQS